MTQGVHHNDWSQSGDITIVPGVDTLGYRGTAGRLDVDNTQVGFGAVYLVLDEGQVQTGEVGAAADAADDDVRIGVCLFHHQL